MRKSNLIITFLLGVVLMAGCNAIEQPATELGAITFGANTVYVGSGRTTRALVDDGSLKSAPVFVSAVTNGSQRLYPVDATKMGERITCDDQTFIWSPVNGGNVKFWEPGDTYAFNGFAYLPENAESNGSLKIENYGGQITVVQPDVYNPSENVDYLYSHTFSVSDGKLRPVVRLDLEHAMSLVEVRIAKHESIADAYLKEVKIEGFWRHATMTCQTPAVYNSGGNNSWAWSRPEGATKTTTYTYSGRSPLDADDTLPLVPLYEREEDESVLLSFVAVPQQLDATALLTISYWVNEKFDESSEDNYVLHEEEPFELYHYTPYIWQPGHRIIYTLEVDTGIHLRGVIQPWVDVDYIEGTVLPEQK